MSEDETRYQDPNELGIPSGDSSVAISETQREKFQRILLSGIHEPISEPSLLLQQKEGLRRLYAFLYLGNGFETLSPFVLDISSKNASFRSQESSPLYKFYMGGMTGKSFGFTVPSDVLESNRGVLWSFPRTLQKGNGRYYWVEVYNPDDQNENITPFSGCRLRPEWDHKKYDFSHWHSIEEELLADYILGENDVTFADLIPIDLLVKHKKFLAPYHLAGRRQITLNLGGNSQISVGDRLRLLPRQDDERSSQWLDVLKMTERQPIDKFLRVLSYRLLPEKHSLIGLSWVDPEQQRLIDFMAGNRNIKFEDLKPIYFISLCQNGVSIGVIQGKQIFFYFPKEAIQYGEEAVLLPRQDGLGRYQWLELYKTDPKTHQPIGDLIVSGRIVDGRIQQHLWLGIERQLLKDYSDGLVNFADLKPVPIQVGEGQRLVHMWYKGGKKVYLGLWSSFNLLPGDNLTLEPEEETADRATFLLIRGEDKRILTRYLYRRGQNKFDIQDKIVSNGDLKVSAEEAERNFDVFFGVPKEAIGGIIRYE